MIPEEKLDQIRARFEFLEARLNAGAAVADLPALSREYAELKPVVEAIDRWRGLVREQEEAERLLADPEMRALAQEELERLRAALPEAERAVQLALLPRDEADERSAILEIRAGTGGEEAALFAADLARMYQRLAEARGWRWEVVEAAPTELGGYRELVAEISGKGVFAALKFESGVHRVQRVPATESERADPHLGGDGGGAARGRGGGRGRSRRRTCASTPCARRARAGSMSTPPTRRSGSRICRPASW